MKILFVWTGLTSYMGDCWRELSAMPGVELKVIVAPACESHTDFLAARELRGLDYALARRPEDVNLGNWKPDAIFLVGWRDPVCRHFALDKRWDGAARVCCLDMPWRWQPRCFVAPLVLGRYARRFAAAYVPGAFCARYSKWIGFRNIHQGLFAIDTERFASAAAASAVGGYFLYLGRYSPEKRLDVLLDGYSRYRSAAIESGAAPLPLRLYGKGDLPARCALDGVEVNGFAAPEDVPALYRGAAAFVLASDFDPWPLVLLEAMSAGCPIIASDKCTNWPELGAAWARFPAGNAAALARCMAAAGELRAAGPEAVRQYDCREWARRTLALAKEVANA